MGFEPMSNSTSKRWKALERDTATALHGRSITEPWQLFRERPDVVVDLPHGRRLVIDAKAYQRFAHHTLLDAVREKYCEPGDVAALVTKAAGQRGAYITLPLEFVAEILNHWRSQT